MTRRLFLHVGMPKCATTTVQGFLRAERDALARRGLAYTMPEAETDWSQGNGATLASRILHGDESWRPLLDTHFETDGDVVISSEVFFGLFNVKRMNDVADHLAAKGVETFVIAYLRRQDLWLESDYKQMVKSANSWATPLKAWVDKREQQGFLNYAMTLTYFGAFFGRDHIRPVLLREGQGPTFAIKAFLDIVGVDGLPRRRLRRAVTHNVSPPTGLIEPARLIKARMLEAGESPERTHRALRTFFREAPKVVEVPARRYLMPAQSRSRAARLRFGSNADMCERFDVGPSFAQDIDEDPASEPHLGQEAARVLDAYLARRGMPDPDAPEPPPAPAGSLIARTLRRLGRG
ncbi:hypothetical protein [Roseivivax sediminis]|uniref:Uncharacterized protein n=1 Tax=Roseivivax sediminis TaxID=936889 RepID=A0A1I1SZU2_9RHOB|nr:hypothetical protein [Roseivivax sediminis]SFD49473.1 hypothetical protein SAMN04515678_101313 [Roseivivax sediminis]